MIAELRRWTLAVSQMMGAARYSTGQSLRLLRDLRSSKGQAGGLYTILGVLPSEGGEPRYRIKHRFEPFERVVTESQLTEPEENQHEPPEIRSKPKTRL
jgi:hypothetical protein